MTLNLGLEDTTLHTVAYKFQSERGVHVHPLPMGLVSRKSFLRETLKAGRERAWGRGYDSNVLTPIQVSSSVYHQNLKFSSAATH